MLGERQIKAQGQPWHSDTGHCNITCYTRQQMRTSLFACALVVTKIFATAAALAPNFSFQEMLDRHCRLLTPEILSLGRSDLALRICNLIPNLTTLVMRFPP